MADLKISELATEASLNGSENVEIVTGGINKKTTTQDIADLAGAGVTAATQAEMITGTDNTKMATPLAVESKGSVKEVSVTNGATGSTDIDCGLKDTHKVLYTVTVTGNITITKSNDTNLQILNVVIPVTGSGITITFPSDVRMARYNEGVAWDQSGKVLTVTSIGTADLHELSLMRAGSVFLLRYDGPFRA